METAEFFNKVLVRIECAVFDLSTPGRELVLALGGVQGGMGLPDEVFAEAFTAVTKKKILLRDPRQAYFLQGLPGYGKTLNELVDYLARLIEDNQISRLTIIGNCMGGFSAIIMGVLLNADEVHAFIPKTTLKWFQRLRFGDYKKDPQIVKMIIRANLIRRDHREYLDLKSFLSKNPDYQGQIHIYTKPNSSTSLLHAEYIRDIPQVIIHGGKTHKADIIRSL